MSRKKTLLSKEAKAAIANAKAANKRAKQIYKAQIKEMRPFLKSLKKIDLRKDISAGQKSYISKAWQEYQELTARPFKVYRTKNKKHLAAAQAYSRHETGAPKFDVAFVPTADPKAKLRFKEDGMTIKSKYVTESVLFFDLKKLAADPQGEIRRTLERNTDAQQFIIMAGKYLYNGGLARSLVENRVTELMARYSPGGTGYDKRGSNSLWSNWLFGLVAFEATNQASIQDYRKAYAEASTKAKRAKRSERRKRGVKYGKKF